jgi:hypothetical protein
MGELALGGCFDHFGVVVGNLVVRGKLHDPWKCMRGNESTSRAYIEF